MIIDAIVKIFQAIMRDEELGLAPRFQILKCVMTVVIFCFKTKPQINFFYFRDENCSPLSVQSSIFDLCLLCLLLEKARYWQHETFLETN